MKVRIAQQVSGTRPSLAFLDRGSRTRTVEVQFDREAASSEIESTTMYLQVESEGEDLQSPSPSPAKRPMKAEESWLAFLFVETGLLLVFQVVLGLLGKSLALIADSAHSGADVITYGLNFYVERRKSRLSNDLQLQQEVTLNIDLLGCALSTVLLCGATTWAAQEALGRLCRSPVHLAESNEEGFQEVGPVLLLFSAPTLVRLRLCSFCFASIGVNFWATSIGVNFRLRSVGVDWRELAGVFYWRELPSTAAALPRRTLQLSSPGGRGLRIDLRVEDLEFLVMPWLAREAEELYGEIAAKRAAATELPSRRKERAPVPLRQSQPWPGGRNLAPRGFYAKRLLEPLRVSGKCTVIKQEVLKIHEWNFFVAGLALEGIRYGTTAVHRGLLRLSGELPPPSPSLLSGKPKSRALPPTGWDSEAPLGPGEDFDLRREERNLGSQVRQRAEQVALGQSSSAKEREDSLLRMLDQRQQRGTDRLRQKRKMKSNQRPPSALRRAALPELRAALCKLCVQPHGKSRGELPRQERMHEEVSPTLFQRFTSCLHFNFEAAASMQVSVNSGSETDSQLFKSGFRFETDGLDFTMQLQISDDWIWDFLPCCPFWIFAKKQGISSSQSKDHADELPGIRASGAPEPSGRRKLRAVMPRKGEDTLEVRLCVSYWSFWQARIRCFRPSFLPAASFLCKRHHVQRPPASHGGPATGAAAHTQFCAWHIAFYVYEREEWASGRRGRKVRSNIREGGRKGIGAGFSGTLGGFLLLLSLGSSVNVAGFRIITPFEDCATSWIMDAELKVYQPSLSPPPQPSLCGPQASVFSFESVTRCCLPATTAAVGQLLQDFSEAGTGPRMDELANALAVKKATSAVYVANFWDSAEDFADDIGYSSPEMYELLMALWQSCDEHCEWKAAVYARAPDPVHPVVTSSITNNYTASQKSTTAGRTRRAIPDCYGHTRQVLPRASQTHQTNPEEAERGTLEEAIWNLLMQAGEASEWHAETQLKTADSLDMRDLWIKRLDGCAMTGLRAALGTFKRWTKWCVLKEVPPFKPTAVQMASFLRQVSHGGPCATVGVARSLGWLSRTLKVDFALERDLVIPWGKVQKFHTPRQVTPFQLKVAIHLETIVSCDNLFVAQVAAGALVIILGTVRYRHIQRSMLLPSSAHMLRGVCSQGKARIGGMRPGFAWLMPLVGFTGVRVGEHVCRIIQQVHTLLGSEGATYLLCDFGPRGKDVMSADCFNNCALSYAKFTAALRRVLQLHPLRMPADEAAQATTYFGRRVMPSIAGLLSLEPSEKAALSNWKDISDEGVSGHRQRTLLQSMPVRYDGTKLVQAAKAKVMCVTAVRIAVSAAERYDLEWGELPRFLPNRSVIEESASQAGEGLGEAHEIKVRAPGIIPFPLKPPRVDSAAPSTGIEQQQADLSAEEPDSSDDSDPEPSDDDAESKAREFLTQGLLEANGLAEEVLQELAKQPYQIKTVKQFANYFDTKGEIRKLFTDKIPAFQNNGNILSGLRQAWREAENKVERALKRSAEGLPEVALDDPLCEEVQKSITKTFKLLHGFEVPLTWMGVDGLLGRFNRELHKHTLVAIKLNKLKTIARANTMGPQAKKQRIGDVEISFGTSEYADATILRSTFHYLMALQVLVFTMAVAGSFRVARGTAELLAAPLAPLLSHLAAAQNFVRRHSIGKDTFSDAEILSGLEQIDEAIRTKWAELHRQGADQSITLGEIIEAIQPFSDTLWLGSPPNLHPRGKGGNKGGKQEYVAAGNSQQRPPPQQPAAADQRGTTAKGNVKTAKHDKWDKPLCKPWNDARGCSKTTGHDGCRHVCDILLPSGDACAQNHTRSQHKEAQAALSDLPVQVSHSFSISDARCSVNNFTSANRFFSAEPVDIANVNDDWVRTSLGGHSEVDLILLFARLPSQGESESAIRAVSHLRQLLLRHATCAVRMVVECMCMDASARHLVSVEFSCIPLYIDSASVSAATRQRLYWLDSEFIPVPGEQVKAQNGFLTVSLAQNPARLDVLEPGWMTHHTFQGQLDTLRGYQPRTRLPCNQLRSASASKCALARWSADSFASHPSCYESHNLLWPCASTHGHEHLCFDEGGRLPSCQELERIQGFPNESTTAHRTHQSHKSSDACRRDALGRSVTIPVLQRLFTNVLVTVGLLPNLPGATPVPHLAFGLWPHQKRPDVLEDLRLRAQEIADKHEPLLQDFVSYCKAKGLNMEAVGADHARCAQRAVRQASTGAQAAMHLSKHGAPALLPHDLAMDDNVKRARSLLHPFTEIPKLSTDLEFAMQQLVDLEGHIRSWREKQNYLLDQLALEAQPLDEEAWRRMAPQTLKVCKATRVGFMLVLVLLLKWPDWSLPDKFVTGFKIAGEVAASNIYRKVTHGLNKSPTDILGQDAEKWNQKVASDNRPHDTDDVILAASEKERDKGVLSPFHSKTDLDKMFGKGRWRAIRRRAIWQETHKKWRQIDNAKASNTNEASLLFETIFTTPYDVSSQLLTWLRRQLGKRLLGSWQPSLGSDDMEDAYRSIPNAIDQLGLCIVAFRHPRWNRIVFAIGYAHLFGFRAAVVNFNRVPELMIASARRLGAVPCWHFFDDSGTLNFQFEGGTGQSFLGGIFARAGLPVHPGKHQPPAAKLLHLGVINDFTKTASDYVTYPPKDGRVATLRKRISSVLAENCLPSGDAASIRGDLGFLMCTSYDKVGRGGQSALIQRQYHDTTSCLTSELRLSLEFFLAVFDHLPVRRVPLQPPKVPPVVLFTDAFFELHEDTDTMNIENVLVNGLGSVLFDGGEIIGHHGKAPVWFLLELEPRKNQIVMCEMLALAAALHANRERIRNRHVILFVDNIAVVCAMVKGASAAKDLQHLVTIVHMMLLKWECSWWIEWVPSECNCSDGLSRWGSHGHSCSLRSLASPLEYVRAEASRGSTLRLKTCEYDGSEALRSDASFQLRLSSPEEEKDPEEENVSGGGKVRKLICVMLASKPGKYACVDKDGCAVVEKYQHLGRRAFQFRLHEGRRLSDPLMQLGGPLLSHLLPATAAGLEEEASSSSSALPPPDKTILLAAADTAVAETPSPTPASASASASTPDEINNSINNNNNKNNNSNKNSSNNNNNNNGSEPPKPGPKPKPVEGGLLADRLFFGSGLAGPCVPVFCLPQTSDLRANNNNSSNNNNNSNNSNNNNNSKNNSNNSNNNNSSLLTARSAATGASGMGLARPQEGPEEAAGATEARATPEATTRPSIFHAPEEPREEDATLRVLCPKAEPEADFELVD
ncbi:unnamed protein product [Polarella glacialis]|uniref:Uncharacterized protein n=1 Tax=Polarella glacialis TaxID=89957 RepID=A0A813GLF6_POLGL|nr:unnamed protein product [Polarella glacialis]